MIPKSIRAIKNSFPKLAVITDVALDPYNSDGHDGLVDLSGNILNDETVAILTQQALCHARAGADIVAPSDMMDGRVGAIRQELDNNSFTDVSILSYSALYYELNNKKRTTVRRGTCWVVCQRHLLS